MKDHREKKIMSSGMIQWISTLGQVIKESVQTGTIIGITGIKSIQIYFLGPSQDIE